VAISDLKGKMRKPEVAIRVGNSPTTDVDTHDAGCVRHGEEMAAVTGTAGSVEHSLARDELGIEAVDGFVCREEVIADTGPHGLL
jgi:hypothetical protein